MTECSWTVCKCEQLEEGQLPLLKVHQLRMYTSFVMSWASPPYTYVYPLPYQLPCHFWKWYGNYILLPYHFSGNICDCISVSNMVII